MPTLIMRTIAATSSPSTPDYSDEQSWSDDIPTNIVVPDEAHVGEVLDQGTMTTGVILGGFTTDATRTITLRAKNGHGFNTKAGVRTTPLDYDSGNGATMETNGPTTIDFSGSGVGGFVAVEGLQIMNTGGYQNAIFSSQVYGLISYPTLINACIVVGLLPPHIQAASLEFRNCLIIGNRGGEGGSGFGGRGFFRHCTIIQRGTPGLTTHAVSSAYNAALLQNCAIFGWDSIANGADIDAGSYGNATDLNASGMSGTSWVDLLTESAQFEDDTADFRAAEGGGLHAGVTSAVLVDISGQARSSPPWIGCWEVAATAARRFLLVRR